MSAMALFDTRILDLTHYIPGPYCTKLLADFGADVIKVENPQGGDIARRVGPFPDDNPDAEKSGLFFNLNTNKLGITLNLKTTEGVQIFQKLVKWADVVVESFRPGVMASFGLDYDALKRVNPKIVMTSISNFGQTGPYRDYKASEIIIYGMGGAMLVTGQPDRYPLKLGETLTLLQSAGIAAVATMAAIFALRCQGTGQHVDISLFETAAGSIDRRLTHLVNYQYTGKLPLRQPHLGTAYPYGIYPCADGFLDIASYAFPRLVQAMGMPDLAKDPQFSPLEGQTNKEQRRAFETNIFLPWLRQRTRREAFEACQQNGIFCGMCNSTEEVAKDPHLERRGFFEDIDHSKAGNVKCPGAPFKMSETPWQIRRPAPLLGQHNEEILGGLGYSDKEIARLKEEGII